jgi:hypothetical protein
MGTFSWIYADNKNRKMRVSELMHDCSAITQQLATDKGNIDGSLKNASDSLKQAYGNIAHTSLPFETVNLGDEWKANIARAISPIIAASQVMSTLNTTSKAWLLSQGRIGEAAFADVVGLPRWMKVGKVPGGQLMMVPIEVIIDINESDIAGTRDRLRQAIHELIPARVTLKKNALINAEVLKTLQAVVAAFDAVKNASIAQDQLDAMLKKIIDQNQTNINTITDETARSTLATLDAGRSSWTKEDA